MVENVTIRDVERELAELRAGSMKPGQHPKLRTSVMTLLAWVPERWVGPATEALAGLAERHPSRTILLFPRRDDPRDALDAEVDLRCFLRGGKEHEICSEVISVRLCGRRASAPASVVEPLLVTDLPVFLRWRGECPFGSPELEELVDVADRLIVDSAEWPDQEAGFEQRLRHRLVADRTMAGRGCGALARGRGRQDAARRRAAPGGRPPRSLVVGTAWPRRRARARTRGGDRARRGGRPPGSSRSLRALLAQRPALRPAGDLRPQPSLRGDRTELLVGTDLAAHAAGWIAERARRSSGFRIALTGGTSVGPVYERLAEQDLGWDGWQVWWSDERDVPPGDERSNERLARDTLLSQVSVPEEHIHPLRSTDVALPKRFDLILLGIGPDGHTASLFPGKPELDATAPVVYVPEPGWEPFVPRYSFSLPLLDAGPTVAFVVGGERKREILARVLAGDESLPAARVRAPETVLLVDEAASPRAAR
jgi:6-phosphogluconolactonase